MPLACGHPRRTYTFETRLFSQNGCLKVRETTSPSSYDSVVLGSCSSPRAKWRKSFLAGPGDLLINTATGHGMGPDICINGPCDDRVKVVPSSDIPTIDILLAWGFDII